MSSSASELKQKHCQACEGGLPPLSAEQLRDYLHALPDWELSEDGRRIYREWRVKDFMTALDFFQRIGVIAEAENHHPDLHLESYRHVTIEIWTHAVGGLTLNDFILAAKIDQLEVAVKP
jgi:4a-hydroxytetrahydrobiopterin dehydratase